MKNLAHEETYEGCKIELHYDDQPESPREWDNVGTMVCWHRRYDLGDEQPKVSADEYLERIACEHDARLRKWADLRESAHHRYCEKDGTMLRIERRYQEHLKRALDEHFIILPLYLYDHSSIAISTGKFSCPWDSGRVGFIYCSKERARKEWGKPGITDEELFKKAYARLKGEVETYDAYLTSQVVGYIAEDPDGEQIGSCWGFYPDEKGDWPYAIEQAKAEIDGWHRQKIETETATTACFI